MCFLLKIPNPLYSACQMSGFTIDYYFFMETARDCEVLNNYIQIPCLKYGFISLKIIGGVKHFEVPLTFCFPGIPNDFQGMLSEYQKRSLMSHALNCCTPTLLINRIRCESST